jgi:hypothetical protein
VNVPLEPSTSRRAATARRDTIHDTKGVPTVEPRITATSVSEDPGRASSLFTLKALQALAWVAEMDRYTSVRVRSYRDDADVGWIAATIYPPARGNFYGRPPVRVYKVSPLGHVYDPDGVVVRDGGIPR